MKKVLFVLGLQNPFSGAAWTRIGFFAETFANRAIKSNVLGTFDPKARAPSIKSNGAVGLFNLVPNIGIDHPLFFAANISLSMVWTQLFLAFKKPDVVVVSFPTGDVGLGALLACRLLGVKCTVDYRDEWEDYLISVHSASQKFFYRFIKKLSSSLYSKSNLVTCVTPTYRELLNRRGVSNLKLLPNGADTKTFKPSASEKKPGGLTVFYSGVIGEYYRLDVAVRALKLLKRKGISDIKLVFAGQGESQRILNLARKLGVADKMDYRGSVSHKELVALINGSDVGLIPYDDNVLWKNSLPAKFFEYCSCGVPVIATAFADSLLAKYILHYQVGLVAAPLDIEGLADAFCTFHSDGYLRVKSGENARVLVEEKFDRNQIADHFFNLLKSI